MLVISGFVAMMELRLLKFDDISLVPAVSCKHDW
jgi:hypothetical protein